MTWSGLENNATDSVVFLSHVWSMCTEKEGNTTRHAQVSSSSLSKTFWKTVDKHYWGCENVGKDGKNEGSQRNFLGNEYAVCECFSPK